MTDMPLRPAAKKAKRWTGPPVPHALYRAYDADGNLLYIGTTRDPGRRVQSHAGYSLNWITRAARLDLEWYPDIASAREAEGRAIAAENPPHNTDGTPRGQAGKFKGSPKRRPWPGDGPVVVEPLFDWPAA